MTTALTREVRRPHRLGGLFWLAILTTTTLTTCGVLVSDHVARSFGESKSQIARAIANQYAYEAYPAWRAANPARLCPVQLLELGEYVSRRDTVDPWGQHFRMFCGERGGITVWSSGEDAIAGTRDDIWSGE